MSFLIPVELEKSSIHGIGVFSTKNVEKGVAVFEREEDLEEVFSPEEFAALSDEKKAEVQHYGYLSKHDGKWYLCPPPVRFVNHSDTPNMSFNGESIVAVRDISAGEELTQDYRELEELREALR